jgi:hypothetical protein
MRPHTCSKILHTFSREVWNLSNFSESRIPSEDPYLSQNLSEFSGWVIETRIKAAV